MDNKNGQSEWTTRMDNKNGQGGQHSGQATVCQWGTVHTVSPDLTAMPSLTVPNAAHLPEMKRV